MEKLGWKGVIYDAWWARFKSGQEGVIVYEGGKECETTDDAKNRIEIEVDKNASVRDERKGYILFTQKGTNCQDIVCISQDAGTSYELKVKDLTINECNANANNFGSLEETIWENTVEIINGVEQVASREGKTLEHPTAEEYNPPTTLNYNIEIYDSQHSISAYGNLIISPAVEELSEVTSGTGFQNPECKEITLEKKSEGDSMGCTGGSVIFDIKIKYEISLSGFEATATYKKCGDVSKTEALGYEAFDWKCESNKGDTGKKTGDTITIEVGQEAKQITITYTYSTNTFTKKFDING